MNHDSPSFLFFSPHYCDSSYLKLIKLLSENQDEIKYVAAETSMLEDWREGVMYSLKVYREKVPLMLLLSPRTIR